MSPEPDENWDPKPCFRGYYMFYAEVITTKFESKTAVEKFFSPSSEHV